MDDLESERSGAAELVSERRPTSDTEPPPNPTCSSDPAADATRAQLPDTRDVRTILEPLKPVLLSILRRFRIPDADAADLLQDTLVDFVQKRRTVAVPEAWLTFVLRRRCIDYIRARDRRFWDVVDHVVLERLQSTQPTAAGSNARTDLERALQHVSEVSREILRRRYVLGESDREIATALGYKENSIAALLRRAQKRLARALLATDSTYFDQTPFDAKPSDQRPFDPKLFDPEP